MTDPITDEELAEIKLMDEERWVFDKSGEKFLTRCIAEIERLKEELATDKKIIDKLRTLLYPIHDPKR